MSSYTLTIIENKTGKITSHECDALFCGCAKEGNKAAGSFSMSDCSGIVLCMAADAAEKAIKKLEEQNSKFASIRKLFKTIFDSKEVKKDEQE